MKYFNEVVVDLQLYKHISCILLFYCGHQLILLNKGENKTIYIYML
jgi:hypothetical protein